MLEKVLEPDLEPVLMLGAEAVGDSGWSRCRRARLKQVAGIGALVGAGVEAEGPLLELLR